MAMRTRLSTDQCYTNYDTATLWQQLFKPLWSNNMQPLAKKQAAFTDRNIFYYVFIFIIQLFWWVTGLPDYTQYKRKCCDKVIFYLCSTKYAYKVMQTKCGKPDKFKTKILRPILIISICQICEAIVTNSWLRKLKACCLHFVKVKTLTSPIMMKPVHL